MASFDPNNKSHVTHFNCRRRPVTTCVISHRTTGQAGACARLQDENERPPAVSDNETANERKTRRRLTAQATSVSSVWRAVAAPGPGTVLQATGPVRAG